MTISADLTESRIEAVADALYALLPVHIRQSDMAGSGAIRALFSVLALGPATIDAELARFRDAISVETASEPALAMIAELVGATLLQPMPPGSGISARPVIANTIRYRRGKGTARVIESLVSDASGLPVVAVEYFQRLGRLAHLTDLRPERPALALLTDGLQAGAAGSAFDLMPRLADFRRIGTAEPRGRHGIASLGLHMLRPVALEWPAPPVVTGPPGAASYSTAALAGLPPMRDWSPGGAPRPGFFQLSPWQGEVTRLFNPRRLSGAVGRRGQTDCPDRLRRLALHKEIEELRASEIEGRASRLSGRPWFDANAAPFAIFLRRGDGDFTRVPPERLRIVNLETPPAGRPGRDWPHRWFAPGDTQPRSHNCPIDCVFDPVTGRLITPAPLPPETEVTEVRISHATGLTRPIGAGPQDRQSGDEVFDIRDEGGLTHLIRLVDPEGTEDPDATAALRHVRDLQTAFEDIRLHGAGRRSLVIVPRCLILAPQAGETRFRLHVPAESEVHLIATDWVLPASGTASGYVLRRQRRLVLDAPITLSRAAPAAGKRAGQVVLDGIAVTKGVTIAAQSLSALRIRHCSLRNPGGLALGATGATAVAIRMEQVICGAVRLGSAAIDLTGSLAASDSVFLSDGATHPALDLPRMLARLCNVTILGEARMQELEGTNVIFAGLCRVSRRQSGCLRYSYAPWGSSLPQSFRCQPETGLASESRACARDLDDAEKMRARARLAPVFSDLSAEEPALAMLHPLCPAEIRSGGEDGAEMGAFSAAGFGIVLENSQALAGEYLSYTIESGVIDDSRSGAIASRRNRP
ncbi:hypothetical protein [Pseudogemmobacter bohemicus]|uniref:hypothetical protein n=1 Tax=Pseudogemmobacter bohemicus TaxID=2250708 RepID=UPI000DD48B86|nr:hypothetical protein [Pseudogemmobacter bohemicus]